METREGGTYSLDSLRTPLTLLYLTNIDCDICEEAGDSIASSAVIRKGWLRREPRRQWKECIDPAMSIYGIADYDFSYLPAFYIIDSSREIIASPQSVSGIEHALIDAGKGCNVKFCDK